VAHLAAEYHFLLHGLVVASEVDLPAPRIPARRADISYRMNLGAALPAPSHSRSDDLDDPWATEHWLGRRLAVEFPGRATFELSRTEAALVRDECNDPDLLVHLLVHHVLPRVVALRGDLVLHAAGAVSPAGRAYLFLGSAGTGKSTLVTGLVREGWLLLDDDGIRLVPAQGEGFVAFPGSPHVGLLPDVSATLLPELEPGRPIAHGSDKRRFAIEGGRLRTANAPAPVAGVFILTRIGVKKIAISQLSFAAALGEIARHGFHLADDPVVIPSQVFDHASALAAATPVWQLRMPNRLGELAAVRELITDVHANG
jgi:hypothetical protein